MKLQSIKTLQTLACDFNAAQSTLHLDVLASNVKGCVVIKTYSCDNPSKVAVYGTNAFRTASNIIGFLFNLYI
ncbi:hypothetical protein [Microvirus mar61]|uniref:Uncharacterized protein n=1 Tax=Microvirus mar61 TaxID=2851198 RepID=A0A8F5RBX1_9VIRU|nr:hypothetical protein [Microvirus mar61]